MTLTSRKWGFVSLFLCVACLGGCVLNQNRTKHHETVNFGESKASEICNAEITTDPTKLIETSVGQEFCIVISSNASTGFAWEYLPPLGSDKVELIEKSYFAPKTPRSGAAGVELLTFRALESGIVEIQLIYKRNWEANIPPSSTQKFEVVIQPK